MAEPIVRNSITERVTLIGDRPAGHGSAQRREAAAGAPDNTVRLRPRAQADQRAQRAASA